MKTCGVVHPRHETVKCELRPHAGQWHEFTTGNGGKHQFRVRPPKPRKPRKLDPPCLEDAS